MVQKILIIDDDADFREAITTLLNTKGYEVAAAAEGKSGFEKALAEVPNLIILDVMMAHETEGFEVARKFQENEKTKNIPVIMVTGVKKEMDLGYDINPDKQWLPVKAVLEKPVQAEKLLEIVKENLA